MEERLALLSMEERVRDLIGIYCAEHFSEKQLSDWFGKIEFEALRPEVSCMAAAVSSAQNYCGVPKELVPRLRGIMKYVQTLNSGMAAGLCLLGKQLNEAGIPATLLGSTAIHFSAPNRPRRHMWQTELGVSEEDFAHVVELAKHAGFTLEQAPYSATACCGNTQCILIRKGMDLAHKEASLTVGGAAFWIPCDAELFVSSAQAAFETLFTMKTGTTLLPWLMDFHCLVEGKPDWEAVAATAQKRGAATQVRLMLELYGLLVPSAAVETAVQLLGTEAQAARTARLLLKYRACKPNTLKRRWFGVQIRNEASPPAALWKAVCRKLTRGS